MSVDQLHHDLAGALEVTAKELADVLELGEQVAVEAAAAASYMRPSGRKSAERLTRHAALVREWHVGSRHTTGIARRAGVMERYRQAAADEGDSL